ncbi:unnamed protein product, partial [Effrenium voratum]
VGGCQPEAGGARARQEEDVFELFASTGFWETRHKDDLVVVVSDILRRLMMPFDGRDAVPPEPLNDLSFASFICNAVMAGLAGGNRLPALDGDRGRDKILFSDGVLLNLPDLSQRKARPSDRMGVRADATSATWSPTNPSDIDQVLAFLETRAQDNKQGRKVIESFQQLASDGCELVTLLRRYRSCDWVLWLLRFFTRAASGVDRYCEFLYLFGPGSSGKDVLLLILLRFLGREDNNYATMLPGSYVVVGGQSDKNGPTENIAQLESKRRTPSRAELQLLAGAATANFPPRVKTHEDEGWSRRARILQTEARFVANPKLLTEHRCDDTLKARVAKGLFSPQLLFFVKGLYTLLGPKYNPGTELIP